MSGKAPINLTQSDHISITRTHFTSKGYRVHSGLQFGCELVLYADEPGRVHSDFCVHVVPPDSSMDWRMVQTLVRSMPDLHKTLIIAHVKEVSTEVERKEGKRIVVTYGDPSRRYIVEELAIATEHAPFRHKNVMKGVGMQIKH
jgi:tRNA-intron lyase